MRVAPTLVPFFFQFIFKGDGWKMDYGGHDSSFHDNIVYVAPSSEGQNCINTGGFLPGHGVHWCPLPPGMRIL